MSKDQSSAKYRNSDECAAQSLPLICTSDNFCFLPLAFHLFLIFDFDFISFNFFSTFAGSRVIAFQTVPTLLSTLILYAESSSVPYMPWRLRRGECALSTESFNTVVRAGEAIPRGAAGGAFGAFSVGFSEALRSPTCLLFGLIGGPFRLEPRAQRVLLLFIPLSPPGASVRPGLSSPCSLVRPPGRSGVVVCVCHMDLLLSRQIQAEQGVRPSARLEEFLLHI